MKTAFGKKEGITALISASTAQIFLNMPRIVAEKAGTAGWILIIYVSALSSLVFFILTKLYKNFQGKDLIDLAQESLGNPGRIISGILYFVLWIFVVSLILRQFAENFKIISLNNSPITYVIPFLIAGIVAAAYKGIEALARVAALCVPIIIGALLLILVSSVPDCEFGYIFPILGNGPKAIFLEGLPLVSLYLGIPLLFFFAPFLQSYKIVKKTGITTLLLTFTLFFLVTIVYQMVYPYPTSTENFLPVYQLATNISLGRFFERFEAVFILVWGMTAFLHMSLLTVVSLQILQKTLKLNSYKPMIPSLAVILFFLSLLSPSLKATIDLEVKLVRTYGLPISGGLALLILIAANIRKKKNVSNITKRNTGGGLNGKNN